MHFNLKVLNLLHSLCDLSSETPDSFRSARYVVSVVEPVVDLPANKECVPECVLSSEAAKNSIVIESKSGTGLSADQLERYRLLRPGFILGSGLHIPKAALGSLDVVVVCHAEFLSRQLDAIGTAAGPIRVVSYSPDDGMLRLQRGELTCRPLHEALAAGLSIPWPPTPHDYFAFDCNSSDMEIAQVIAPAIELFAIRRHAWISCADICHEANLAWHVAHPKHKTALATRVTRVMEGLLSVGYAGQFQLVERKGGLFARPTPAALRSALKDQRGQARRLTGMRKTALEDLQRKLDSEKRDRIVPMFPEAELPPDRKRRGRRRR